MKQLKHLFAVLIIPFIQPSVNAATIQEIEQQYLVVTACCTQYNLANKEKIDVENKIQSAFNKYTSLSILALMYFDAGYYTRGTYYQCEALAYKAEYDQYKSILPEYETKVTITFNKYILEYNKLQTMLNNR